MELNDPVYLASLEFAKNYPDSRRILENIKTGLEKYENFDLLNEVASNLLKDPQLKEK